MGRCLSILPCLAYGLASTHHVQYPKSIKGSFNRLSQSCMHINTLVLIHTCPSIYLSIYIYTHKATRRHHHQTTSIHHHMFVISLRIHHIIISYIHVHVIMHAHTLLTSLHHHNTNTQMHVHNHVFIQLYQTLIINLRSLIMWACHLLTTYLNIHKLTQIESQNLYQTI